MKIKPRSQTHRSFTVKEYVMAKKTEATVEDLLSKIYTVLVEINTNLNKPMVAPAEIPSKSDGKMVVVSETPGEEISESVTDEDEPPVPLNTLREVATKYSTRFGMDALLTTVAGYGNGKKKLSEVPVECYGNLYKAMMEKLTDEPDEIPAEEEPVTLDQLKASGKAFLEREGKDAFLQLLKSFGAAKLSEVAADKYAALNEALANA